MPKAPRHRKRVRTARLQASAAPLQPQDSNQAQTSNESPTPSQQHQQQQGKKVGKKEAEVTNLLDKLRSDKPDERIWASAALSNILLTLPPVTLRLLLSKNLIGLLIERLTDAEESVAVEALGALRNLAVTSPSSIVSEMHNKRLLLPLMSTHVPLLVPRVHEMLLPPAEPLKPTLPATAEQRKQVDIQNAKNEQRRRMFWDWSENVFMLLWCLAESTTKILGSLNAHADKIVEFALAYLDEGALGLSALGEENGMDVEGKKSKKGKKADEAKRERVPLFVAVSAAQTLHAFLSSNPTSHLLLLQSPLLPSLTSILTTSTPPTQKTARTDSHAASDPASDAEDWLQLRVLAFGILLELTKAGGKGLGRDEMRETLKESQGLLLSLVATDLNAVAAASVQTHSEMDPKLVEAPSAASTAQAIKLASIERQLSTLQLSLEILGEWCATLDAEGLGSMDEDDEDWGGIAVDGEGDVEMGMDEDDDVPADGVFRKQLPKEEEDGMMAGEEEEPVVELSSSALSLFADLPLQLLKLAHPTPLSFLRQPTDTTPTTAPSTLLPTSDATSSTPSSTADLPALLTPIADILTTLHVRSLECLNNLYITLSRASSSESVSSFLSSEKQQSDLQQVWEATLGLVQGAAEGAKSVESGKEGDVEEVEQRKMEVVGAGVGAAWGMARIGLGEEGKLIVGPSTTPFLITMFSHPYATLATPAGEAVRVRIAGALGWIGRREDVSAEENESIGLFLLSLLPNGKTPSPLSPTPEVLLQAIDSLIDLYSDEEAPYDVPVFREKGFLQRLDASVAGVRAAAKKLDRKKFPELRSRADGALENLTGFVQYRKEVARY
ncbi:hypothetical protein BCR35DRAFT_307647 [Leucosporidium creatinivorum]|uniref:SYO1-like TPR repeats domain-containing protein n=1 Tax=Leucosporidium creatinivorum TaxID=106004 RepID=A0A1Y2ELG7_9BASI|nr:hypothetical protein BCR35DRAFT_307647 [Leucosporidium creatinivorum]